MSNYLPDSQPAQKKTFVIVFMVFAVLSFPFLLLASQTIELAGRVEPNPFHPTDYQIVIADSPKADILAAAGELSGFLEQVTGIEFPVVHASSCLTDHQILVGPSEALNRLDVAIDWEALGAEGFIIRTVGQKIVIVGGPRRGTANGVYTFLEDIIGCRWYTPTFSVIPKKPVLQIEPLDVFKIPVFEARSLYGGSATDVTWAARQRLNTFTRDIKNVGGIRPDGRVLQWGSFINDPKISGAYHYARSHVHTLGHGGLLPYEEFDHHPEYFALVNGQRLREGQPCLTNPELFNFIVEQAKSWIRSNPTADIISISQGDFHNACECPACMAAYESDGRPGLYMRFVNQIAAEIEKDSPHILVDTLAYGWTDTPPQNVTMRSNVVVRYCPIDACLFHAFDQCELSIKINVCPKMDEWVRISPRVWLWYYALPYNDLYPMPNLNSLSRNFQIFRDAGIKGFFIEGKGMIMSGGLSDLQAYLFAKLMWNPDYDVQKGMEEFANACYGAAAEHIISYIAQVNNRDTYINDPAYQYYPDYPGFHIRYYAQVPIKTEKLKEMDSLFDQAEQAAAGDTDCLERVKLVRLSLQYAILRNADRSDPIYEKAFREFFPAAKKAGIRLLLNHTTQQREDLETLMKSF